VDPEMIIDFESNIGPVSLLIAGPKENYNEEIGSIAVIGRKLIL
jgi:hypothetical protein